MTTLTKAEMLLQEAYDILDKTDLLGLMGRYGRAELVGSVALELVVKPDIDVHVLLSPSTDLRQAVSNISFALLDVGGINEVRLTDYRSMHAIKVGVDRYQGNSTNWTFDVWVTTDPSTTAFEVTEDLRSRLTTTDRTNILAIKTHYYGLGELRHGLSARIYQSVLEGGVSTVDEFKTYLVQDEHRSAYD